MTSKRPKATRVRAPRRGTADAYAWIAAAIISGKLLPNERLIEDDLAARTGSTRGKVRLALDRLAMEGLVVREPNRGARVRLITEAEAVEILEARAALEAFMARRAAERASKEHCATLREIVAEMAACLNSGDLAAYSQLNARLHQLIIEIARQALVAKLLSMLHSQAVRFQFRTVLYPGRATRSLAEHRALVEAICRKDGAQAERCMHDHLSHVIETLHDVARIEERI